MNTAAIATKLNVLESAIVRIEEWANVLFVVAKGVGARFVSKKINVEVKMTAAITSEHVLNVNNRARNVDVIVNLANDLVVSIVPVRSCDPIQVWEKHPVVSRYLDVLKDKEISIAIDLAATAKDGN